MKAKFTIAALFLSILCQGLFAQVPLVYSVENTGKSYPPPILPSLSQLPVIDPLPDPFMWSNGNGRSTSFGDWARRRNEIKKEIEHYEIGVKPDRPENITANYVTGGTLPAGVTGRLIVDVTVNGQTLTLTANVSLPAGSGPFPVVIGMNSLNGSIPADIFTSRNIARITFSHNQVTSYPTPQITDPYFRLYPEFNLANLGQYSAWAWGVSRLIDGLELAQSSLPIDLKHLAVTGCSYAGKMALFAGAFDERIALTIAQESGGGGAPAWRVSETIGDVEKLGATSNYWFKDSMFQFAGLNVSKLPHDHHELMAMVAPRALLVTGNTDFMWLANPSTYVSARATKEIYKTFGIGDRFGFYIDGGHNHCAIPTSQRPAIEAFVDKFMIGKTDVNTDTVTINPYPKLDYESWYKWWGTGNPVFPDDGNSVKIWREAECGTVGSNWDILTDPTASKGGYVTIKSGLNSTGAAPKDTASNQVVIPFTVDSAANYNFLARAIGATPTDDSYWVKVDSGAFVSANGLAGLEWQWGRLTSANLSAGQHTLTIAYREDGAKLDKVLITTSNASTIVNPEFSGPNCGGAPVITPSQIFSVSETAANGSSFGNVSATDPDEGTVFQKWKITGGSGVSAFAINKNTGQLTILDHSSHDFESSTRSYTLTLTVSDGYFTSTAETVTINLLNANDNAPVITPGMKFSLDGGSCDKLGKVKATDADDTNQPGFTNFQNWQITGGSVAELFAINSSTGMISIANPQHMNLLSAFILYDLLVSDFLGSSYNLLVTVGDGVNTSAAQRVAITIPNKINVCHKGQLISVSKIAAIGHIQHGDCIGSCSTEAKNARRPDVSSDQALANSIKVYPNPTKGNININLGTNSQNIRIIEVVDLSGKIVMQQSVIKPQTIVIPGGRLKPGIYMIRMRGDKVTTQKIVVQ